MKVYYAHCMALYDTPQEQRDIDTLKKLGYEVCNPNCTKYKKSWKNLGMAFGEQLVAECDVFAFRALPDGRIPSGVFKELEWAMEQNKPVIELPSGIFYREMNIKQTANYLQEIGQR